MMNLRLWDEGILTFNSEVLKFRNFLVATEMMMMMTMLSEYLKTLLMFRGSASYTGNSGRPSSKIVILILTPIIIITLLLF